MGRQHIAFIVLASILLFTATGSLAQLGPPPPKEVHMRLTSTLGLGTNELIGGWITRLFAYIPYGNSDNFLFEQAHVRAGLFTELSPEFARSGPFIGISPALFFDLDIGYNMLFDWSAESFDSYDHDHDHAVLNSMSKEFVLGHMFYSTAVVKAMAGPVVLLSTTEGYRWEVPKYYFSIEMFDIVEPGWSIKNHNVLGVMADGGYIPFLEYQIIHYYPTDFEKSHVGFGVIATDWIPYTMVYGMMGYHIHNPDFDGWKFLVALISDFPLTKKKK